MYSTRGRTPRQTACDPWQLATFWALMFEKLRREYTQLRTYCTVRIKTREVKQYRQTALIGASMLIRRHCWICQTGSRRNETQSFMPSKLLSGVFPGKRAVQSVVDMTKHDDLTQFSNLHQTIKRVTIPASFVNKRCCGKYCVDAVTRRAWNQQEPGLN